MTLRSYQSDSFANTLSQRTTVLRARLSKWSKQPTVVRSEKPTNIATARRLGYKAVKTMIIARVRLGKGRRVRDRPTIGRKPGRNQKRVSPSQSREKIAMAKAHKKFPNMYATKAYFVGQNGTHAYYEVILQKA